MIKSGEKHKSPREIKAANDIQKAMVTIQTGTSAAAAITQLSHNLEHQKAEQDPVKLAKNNVNMMVAAHLARLHTTSSKDVVEGFQHVIPQSPRMSRDNPLMTVLNGGAHIIAMAENKLLQPWVSPIVTASILGTHGYRRGTLDNHSTVDLLDKGRAVQILDKPFEIAHHCIFVSTSPMCTSNHRQKQILLGDQAQHPDAPLETFLTVVQLPIRGIHKRENPLMLHVHLCYNVYEVWDWLETQGLALPTNGGLDAVVHGSTAAVRAALSTQLPNPAHLDSHICTTRAATNFRPENEPKLLSLTDTEQMLKGVMALLYIRIVMSSATDCDREIQILRESLRHTEDKFKQVHKIIVNSSTTPSKRVAAMLYYLYGPNRACQQWQHLYPHGTELTRFVQDLSKVREQLSPWAARHHFKNALLYTAHSAARGAVSPAIRAGKHLLKATVRPVLTFASKMLNFVTAMHLLKPVICCLGFAVLLFTGNDLVKNAIESTSLCATILHVMFGHQLSSAFMTLSNMYMTLQSVRGVNQVTFIVLEIVKLIVKFFNDFLPRSAELFSYCRDLTFGSVLLKGIPLDLAKHAENVARLAAAAAFGFAWVMFPIEAMWNLGKHAGELTHYITQSEPSTSMWIELLTIAYMARNKQFPYIFLRCFQFMCVIHHGPDSTHECEERHKKYHKLYHMLTVVSFAYNIFFGGLMFKLLDSFGSAVATLYGEQGFASKIDAFCLIDLVPQDAEVLRTETEARLGKVADTTGYTEAEQTLREAQAAYVSSRAAQSQLLKLKYSWENGIHKILQREGLPTDGILSPVNKLMNSALGNFKHIVNEDKELLKSLNETRTDIEKLNVYANTTRNITPSREALVNAFKVPDNSLHVTSKESITVLTGSEAAGNAAQMATDVGTALWTAASNLVSRKGAETAASPREFRKLTNTKPPDTFVPKLGLRDVAGLMWKTNLGTPAAPDPGGPHKRSRSLLFKKHNRTANKGNFTMNVEPDQVWDEIPGTTTKTS
jgi:hypothetical protein